MAGVATDPSVQILVDVSHWKSGLSPAKVATEGIDGLIAKATDPSMSGGVDPTFAAYMNAAHSAGMPFACFIYQQGKSSVRDQLALAKKYIPRDVPVIPDVEANSGPISMTRQLVDALQDSGYTVPWAYIPRWYWQQQGSPSLAGLPPLWSSRYPDNKAGSLQSEYNAIPASYWTGYGGLRVGLLQFTSSGKLVNYPSVLDFSAFPGTRAQLLAVLQGGSRPMTDTTTDQIDDNNAAIWGREGTTLHNDLGSYPKHVLQAVNDTDQLLQQLKPWLEGRLNSNSNDARQAAVNAEQNTIALRAEASTMQAKLDQILAAVVPQAPQQ